LTPHVVWSLQIRSVDSRQDFQHQRTDISRCSEPTSVAHPFKILRAFKGARYYCSRSRPLPPTVAWEHQVYFAVTASSTPKAATDSINMTAAGNAPNRACVVRSCHPSRQHLHMGRSLLSSSYSVHLLSHSLSIFSRLVIRWQALSFSIYWERRQSNSTPRHSLSSPSSIFSSSARTCCSCRRHHWEFSPWYEILISLYTRSQ